MSPMALTTTTTWLPASLAAIARRAARWILLGVGDAGAAEFLNDQAQSRLLRKRYFVQGEGVGL